MPSRRLDDLDPSFRPLAVELIARACEARIPLKIIETRRSQAEQEEYVRTGRSWTRNGKHVLGKAIDLCPTELLSEPNWKPESLLWVQLGAIAEGLGLTWGGGWRVRDACHFEMP